MRRPSASTQKANDSSVERSYEVGYRKPPEAGQFKKGQSGNPTGRPKGKADKKNYMASLTAMTTDMILEEALRPVTIREGEKTFKMPMIQATIRAMGIGAMKGNRFSQRDLMMLAQAAASERAAELRQKFDLYIDMKAYGEALFKQHDDAGLPRPDIFPHPDDILIDPREGTAEIVGPHTNEEHQALNRTLASLDTIQDIVTDLGQKAKRGRHKASFKVAALKLQRHFDEINLAMPKRHKRFLKDRISDDGSA